MKLIFAALTIVALAGIGCTGERHITMHNTTGKPMEVIFTLNEDSLSGNPFFITGSEELRFNLNKPKSSRITMTFGDGGWSPSEVQKLVGFLKSIQVVTPTQKLKLESLQEMKDYLLARRRGLGGAKIEIKAG